MIVLNMQAPSEEKSDDSKDNFYENSIRSFNPYPTNVENMVSS